MSQRQAALLELGDHVLKIASTLPASWQTLRSSATDPVALDKFALQLVTVSQALGQLAERTQQLAEAILDGEDD